MLNTLSKHPGIAVGSGVGSGAASFYDILTQPLEFIVLLGSAIIVILTIVLKVRELFKKRG